MARTAGAFRMNANNYEFTLVFAPYTGSNRIAGAMIPRNQSGNTTHAVEGTVEGGGGRSRSPG